MKEMPSILKLPDIVEGGSTVIEVHAFKCQSWIKEVIIPEGFTKIGSGAFYKCFNLRKVTLPSTLTHIEDNAFLDCSELEEINLGHVKHIGEFAFRDLARLGRIDLTSIETLGDYAFMDCKMEWLCGGSILGETYFAYIKTIGTRCFNNATFNDDDPSFGNDFKFGEHLISIGDMAFSDSDIDSMNLADCKNLTSIGVEAFARCESLQMFDFPEENKLKELRDRVFLDCFFFKEIDLPEGLTKIGKRCFESGERLERVVWPASLKSVGMNAFYDCRELRKPSEAVFSQWDFIGEDAFNGCKIPPPTLFENPNVFVELSTDELNSDVCGICLDSLTTTAPTCQLSCGHIFHQKCAHDWYRRNQTCSKCRRSVTSVAIVLPMDKDNKRKRPAEVEEPLKRQCQHEAVQPSNCA